jgi:hypothetical protein
VISLAAHLPIFLMWIIADGSAITDLPQMLNAIIEQERSH